MNRLVVAGLAVVVAVGASAGYLWYREQSKKTARITQMLREADLELAQDAPDRGELARIVRAIGAALDEGFDSVALRRARARLRAALGNDDREAWADLQAVILTGDANRQDRLLGAQLMFRIHASVSGRAADGQQALELAQQVLRGEGAPPGDAGIEARLDESAGRLAWVLAYRLGRGADWKAAGDMLRERFPEGAGRTVEALGGVLAGDLLLWHGYAMSRDGIAEAKTAADADHVAVGEAAAAFAASSPAELAVLERLDPPPGSPALAELDFALAFLRADRLSGMDPGPERDATLEQAAEEVERSLRAYPRSVGARHTRLILHVAAGQIDKARTQARWLLENAPGSDRRREIWSRF